MRKGSGARCSRRSRYTTSDTRTPESFTVCRWIWPASRRSIVRRVKHATRTRPAPRRLGRKRSREGGALRLRLVAERQRLAALVDVDRRLAAVLQLTEQDLVGERALDLRLDEARHRPGAERR